MIKRLRDLLVDGALLVPCERVQTLDVSTGSAMKPRMFSLCALCSLCLALMAASRSISMATRNSRASSQFTKGWNYIVGFYRPRAEVLDGLWKFPDAQAVN